MVNMLIKKRNIKFNNFILEKLRLKFEKHSNSSRINIPVSSKKNEAFIICILLLLTPNSTARLWENNSDDFSDLLPEAEKETKYFIKIIHQMFLALNTIYKDVENAKFKISFYKLASLSMFFAVLTRNIFINYLLSSMVLWKFKNINKSSTKIRYKILEEKKNYKTNAKVLLSYCVWNK